MSKEVKAAIGILDELNLSFDTDSFNAIRKRIEEQILHNSSQFTDLIRNGTNPRVWVLSSFVNLAGDSLESGVFHLYRGVLNDEGKEYLKSFNYLIDELVVLREIDQETAKIQKETMLDLIRLAG
jgi:hypothetical protein